jgi:hypothetical protein
MHAPSEESLFAERSSLCSCVCSCVRVYQYIMCRPEMGTGMLPVVGVSGWVGGWVGVRARVSW